jgi:hypothetical protein
MSAGMVASIGCNRNKPMPYTNELKFDDTSMKKNVSHPQSLHWVNMRWQPDLTATNDAADVMIVLIASQIFDWQMQQYTVASIIPCLLLLA